MENECGIVREIKGNRALLVSDPVSFCSGCTNEGCGMKKGESRYREIWVENTLQAKVGDRVYFEISPQSVVLSAILLYGLPVFFLISGIIFSKYLPVIFNIELSAVLYGLLFFVLSYIIIAYLTKYRLKNLLKVKMIKVENVQN